MTANRNYSNTAGVMALQADITNSSTTLTVNVTTGLPSPNFIIAVDYGTSGEELCLCTNVVGTTLTVQRGYDGTSAGPHLAGATIRHVRAAIDDREAAVHINATSGTHGVTGVLLGSTDSQSVDNKTFVSGNGSTVPLKVKAASVQSSNLTEWQNSSGTAIGNVDPVGRITAPGLYVTKPTNSFATIVGRMGVGQTLPLLDLQDSSGASVFAVSIGGALTASGTLSVPLVAAGKLSVTSVATNQTVATVKGAASQTSDLQQWQNSSATALAKVTKDGNGVFANLPGKMLWGSSVVATDSNGLTSIPTGLTTIQMFVCWIGDAIANPNVTIGRYGSYSGAGGVPLRARNGADSTAYGLHNLRIDWIAIGSS